MELATEELRLRDDVGPGEVPHTEATTAGGLVALCLLPEEVLVGKFVTVAICMTRSTAANRMLLTSSVLAAGLSSE